MRVICEGELDHEQRRCCEGPNVQRVTYQPPPGEYLSGVTMGAEWCAWCLATARANGFTILAVEPITRQVA